MSDPSPADPSTPQSAQEPLHPESAPLPSLPASSAPALGLSFDHDEPSQLPAPAVDGAQPAPPREDALAAGVEGSSLPAHARVFKEARFTESPPETRTISPAPERRTPHHTQPTTPPARPSTSRRASYVDPPTLTETHKDLRTLLKSFLLLVPRCVRQLRFLLPSPARVFARFIIRQVAMFLHARGALGSNLVYDVVASMWRIVITIFFREIRSRGAWKIPRAAEGPVIFVVGPHHNQFLDPLLLMSEVKRESGRRISFLTAAKSMDRAFVGLASRLMQSIPVARAQDYAFAGKGTIKLSESDPCVILGEGTSFTKDFEKPRSQVLLPRNLGSSTAEVVEVISDTELRLKKEFNKKATEGLRAKADGTAFKVLPHVDQSSMYSAVYQRLTEGGCIGIFPEGGSHDRTDLLPLKAGVSIMALGAISAHPDLHLQIVPVGLSYFHPHKFRSRAVVEFGSPIEIPRELVSGFEQGGDSKKKAISEVMDLVVNGLKSVTVRAPDFDTLMLVQAARRLYRPPGQNLTLGQVVELNKRFIVGYDAYKEDPRIKNLERRVREYNTLLRYLGLKDHQVDRIGRPRWRSFALLCYRLGLLGVWGVLALPGVILNSPIFLAAKLISRKKAKEALAASSVKIAGRDVLATWKVLVALAGAPSLYTIYAINAVVLAHKLALPPQYRFWAPFATFAGLPFIGVAALKFGEVGMDVYKSLRPLVLSLVPGKEPQLMRVQRMREELASELNGLVDELAPALFDDFSSSRIIPSAAAANQRRDSAQGKFFQHPLSWVDELFFGQAWSSSMAYPQDRHVKPNQGESAFASGMESDVDGAFTDGQGTGSGYVSGYTTEEAPDYDEVIHILNREQGHPDSPAPGPRPALSRRVSRQRSRSNVNLAALSPVSPTTPLASASGVQAQGAEARRRHPQGE
ncbi:Glycerol-3-phosphate/dihydroxyacetone phosphate acyltransferase [Rhodotorula kratochvilovae]